MKKFFLFLLIIPFVANATSVPAPAPEVARSLVPLHVVGVESTGIVLNETFVHPKTTYLIGLKAKVALPNVCTEFVGQTTSPLQGTNLVNLTAHGTVNPLEEYCIDIAPMPVETMLTVPMEVLTGGFVPADKTQELYLQIRGLGIYTVELNTETKAVTVTQNLP